MQLLAAAAAAAPAPGISAAKHAGRQEPQARMADPEGIAANHTVLHKLCDGLCGVITDALEAFGQATLICTGLLGRLLERREQTLEGLLRMAPRSRRSRPAPRHTGPRG